MKRLAGQAGRGVGTLAHRLLHLALLLAVVAASGSGVLALRLSRGPLDLPFLARWAGEAASSPGGTQVRVGRAALTWEGWRLGVDRPVDVRLADVVATAPGGKRLARIPDAAVSLSLGWLLLGDWVPRALEVDGAKLRVVRGGGGGVRLDLGGAGREADASGAGPFNGLLGEMARPPTSDLWRGGGKEWRWSQLRRVRLSNAEIIVVDRQLGVVWQARDAEIDLRRQAQGGVDGTASAMLATGDQNVALRARAVLEAGSAATRVNVSFSPVRLAALARGSSPLAPLAMLDAPVSGQAALVLGRHLAVRKGEVHLDLGGGVIRLGQGAVPLGGGTADIAFRTEPWRVTLDGLRLRLGGGGGGGDAGPVLTLNGEAHPIAARIAIRLDAALDHLSVADLAGDWPKGVAEGARDWVTANVTAGEARGGHVALALSVAPDGGALRVEGASGGLVGSDVTVHWLRPLPPLEHAEARLSVVSPDTLLIETRGGRQQGTGIALGDGTMEVTRLTGAHQFGDIALALEGPVADTLTLLEAKRLHLLDTRKLPFVHPSGQVAGRLHVTLPLEKDVTIDQVVIRAQGQLRQVHLGSVFAGRDLDGGTMGFEAGNDGLTLSGQASLAGLPVRLGLRMDFRAGPPAQETQRLDVATRADARQLAAAGIDPRDVLSGTVAARVRLIERRDGTGQADIHADLGGAALSLAELGWRKAAGKAASGGATVMLDHDRIVGVDELRLEGDGLSVSGGAAFAGGRPSLAWFDRIVLGDTRASGTVAFSGRPGAPVRVRLSGSRLDLSGAFGARTGTSRADGKAGTAYVLDARFAELRTGRGSGLADVSAHAESDGRILRRARVEGRTGAKGAFSFAITPGPQGRAVSGSSRDAGGLLGALHLADGIGGGRLSLRGIYDDASVGHPLAGTLRIDAFQLRDAPAAAKLMQAMTLYGLVDALRGPGMAVSRLVVPFRYADDVLAVADARAFSPSLGVTAKGRVNLARDTAELRGTIVPAYFFNTLLGRIPLVGRLFSPERGGGVFAATYELRGRLDDPSVSVNPLAALTPGFMRGVFGIFGENTGEEK